ncbi:MAG: FkbM family methyltransferase [Actinobacteria bacterium]|nr:FkbM family methyltransferase [Actinomycetota bacterium]
MTAPTRLTVTTAEWAASERHLAALYAAMRDRGVAFRTATLRSWVLAPHGSGQDRHVYHLNWLDHLATRQPLARSAATLAKLAALLVLARCRGRRVWWTVHNVEPHDPGADSRVFTAAMALTFGLADTVQFLSSSAELAFLNKFKPPLWLRGKVLVTPLPMVSIGPRQPSREARGDGPVTFLLFGKLRRAKNVVDTIQSFTQLGDGKTPRRLIVAGEPVDPAHEAAILDSAADAPNIELRLRRHTDDELLDLLVQADWGVFLYQRTSNSGALVASLGAGLPAIASDLAYFRELAESFPGAIELTPGSARVPSKMWDRWAAQAVSPEHEHARRSALKVAEAHHPGAVAATLADRLVTGGPPRSREQPSIWLGARARSALDLASRLTVVSSARAQRYAGRLSRESEPELRLVTARAKAVQFVDVGANAGIYTAMALRCGARSVVAVEPLPELADRLRSRFGRRVDVVAGALSSASGSASLTVPVVDGVKRHTRATLESGVARGDGNLLVPLSTLDDLTVEFGAMVKIDVEGHEMEVLAGGARVLADQVVRTWLVEAEVRHDPAAVSNLVALMANAGYVGWAVCPTYLVPIDDFDPTIHQSAADQHTVMSGGQRPPTYANIFCFVPRWDEQSFVLSARRAGFSFPEGPDTLDKPGEASKPATSPS